MNSSHSHHPGISKPPHVALFGATPQCGILSLGMIPKENLDGIESEEQLETLVESISSTFESTSDTEQSLGLDDGGNDARSLCVTWFGETS